MHSLPRDFGVFGIDIKLRGHSNGWIVRIMKAQDGFDSTKRLEVRKDMQNLQPRKCFPENVLFFHDFGAHSHRHKDSTCAAEPSRSQLSSCACSLSCCPRMRGTTKNRQFAS